MNTDILMCIRINANRSRKIKPQPAVRQLRVKLI